MKHQVRKFATLITGALLAGSMAFFNPVLAATGTPAPARAQHIKQAATAKIKQEARKKSENFNADAVAAIKQVEQAANQLKDAKYDDAVKSLESADGKLEVAMASDPSLKLIPVAEDVNTYDLMVSPEQVKNELNAISKELKSGNVQDARVRLDQLRSELIIRDVYLPVETYPAAIKQAVKEVFAKQYQQAQDQLSGALSRLLVVAENYPQLKANENFLALQTQLEGTENRIAVERRKFNQAVQEYNTKIRTFPTLITAKIFNFKEKQYFKSAPGTETPPNVNFDFDKKDK